MARSLPNGDDPLYRVVVRHLREGEAQPYAVRTFGPFQGLRTAKAQATYRYNDATRNGRKASVRVERLIIIPQLEHVIEEAPGQVSDPAIYGTRDDLIWLAGLLEGEGTFDAHRGRYPRVRLCMTDRDVVTRAANLMGTSVRLSLRQAPSSPTWNAELSGDRAAAVMEAILPLMGTRRSQRIAEVIATSAFYKGHDRKTLPGPSVAAIAA